MTVSNDQRLQAYVGDGVEVDFAFTMQASDESWIFAYVDGVETAGTVVLNPDQTIASGGTFTFFSAPADQSSIIILRTVPLTQELSLPDLTPFPARNVEDELDKLTMAQQQALDSFNPVAIDATLFNSTVNGVYLLDDGNPAAFLSADGTYKVIVQSGGGVLGVQSGSNITVDNTVPELPVVNLDDIINLDKTITRDCEVVEDGFNTGKMNVTVDVSSDPANPVIEFEQQDAANIPYKFLRVIGNALNLFKKVVIPTEYSLEIDRTPSQISDPKAVPNLEYLEANILFKSATAPLDTTYRWFNTNDNLIYFYDGANWVTEQEFCIQLNEDSNTASGVFMLYGQTRLTANYGVVMNEPIKLNRLTFNRTNQAVGDLEVLSDVQGGAGVVVDSAPVNNQFGGNIDFNNKALLAVDDFLTMRWVGVTTQNLVIQIWYRRYAV